MNSQNSNEIIDISDSESEAETVSYRSSPIRQRGTPFPGRNLEDEYNNYIRELNQELNVSHIQLEHAVNHYLRFSIMVFTRLRSVMDGYDETGEYKVMLLKNCFTV